MHRGPWSRVLWALRLFPLLAMTNNTVANSLVHVLVFVETYFQVKFLKMFTVTWHCASEILLDIDVIRHRHCIILHFYQQ